MPSAWWQLYSQNLSPAECEDIKALCLKFPSKKGVVGYGGTAHAHEMRESDIRWIPRYDEGLHWLFSHLVLNILESNHKAFHLELDDYPRLKIDHGQFTEYRASQSTEEADGHYDWHEDNCWISPQKREHDRKISLVLQLSDPSTYEGGKLELERDQPSDDRFSGQGSIILFPSHLRHRVTPVTQGVRHSFVVWATGKPLS